MISRYKILEKDFPAVKKYLSGKSFKKDTPSWGVKFKDDLKVERKIVLQRFRGDS